MRSGGRIITFYSYKGGTGRSMALANLAWVLASNDKRVLLVDWDLEAPGLHRYLKPFLVDPELRSTPGLIDFVWDVAKDKMTPISGDKGNSVSSFSSLEDYVVGLDWTFLGRGSIAFIPAGRQDQNYAQRVNTFDWDNFYERLGGGKLLQEAREDLRSNYDYILIDSRTGVSDTSSICTVQLPDLLVVCFTLNRQSINGAAAVAASVIAQREQGFKIYPVPTRLENAETDKLKSAIRFARGVFAPLLLHVQYDQKVVHPEQQVRYWNAVETPYKTFYAFEEVPAAFNDPPGGYGTILASTERLAYWISDGDVGVLKPDSEERREAVVAAYAFSREELGLTLNDPKGPGHGWFDAIHGLYDVLRGRALLYSLCIMLTLLSVALLLYSWIQKSQLNSVQNQFANTKSLLDVTQRNLNILIQQQQKSPESTPAPSEGLAAAMSDPENKSFLVFPHYRANSQVSSGYNKIVKELLLEAGFQVQASTAETKQIVPDKAIRKIEGPRVDYFSDTSNGAAKRIALILNSRLPKELSEFTVQKRKKPRQSTYIGVWF
jgi:MinD-like ATPase involved in chromosome partitioning or flagellar assembly